MREWRATCGERCDTRGASSLGVRGLCPCLPCGLVQPGRVGNRVMTFLDNYTIADTNDESEALAVGGSGPCPA